MNKLQLIVLKNNEGNMELNLNQRFTKTTRKSKFSLTSLFCQILVDKSILKVKINTFIIITSQLFEVWPRIDFNIFEIISTNFNGFEQIRR